MIHECVRGCVCYDKPWYFRWGVPALKWNYWEVPKCASTSVKTMIKGAKRQAFASAWPSFAVVRNPWDRMVSNYIMWRGKRRGRFESFYRKEGGQHAIDTFTKFIDFTNGVPNHHWAPQVDFLPGKLDRVIFFDRFEEEFSAFLGDIGKKPPSKMPRKNKTRHGPYWEYYTPYLVDAVADLYADDIDRFEFTYGE